MASALWRQLLIGLAAMLCCLGLQAGAWAASASVPAADGEQPLSYHQATDQQLTVLAARWDHLNPAERRALLSEVKLRMARQQSAQSGAPTGVLRIRLTRRYGAGRKNPAKGQLHIQVQATPRGARVHAVCQGPPGSCPDVQAKGAPTPIADERQKYGLGFEQRTGRQPAAQAPKEFTVQAADSD